MDLDSSAENESDWCNSSSAVGRHGMSTRSHSSHSYYISFGLITVPGIVTNSLALFFIIRDMRKAVFPAIILILTLCFSDLIAVIFSAIRHTATRYISDISYSMCASLSVPHTFFRSYSGIVNSMMAVDRVLAICFPFYYRKNVELNTWKISCVVAAFTTACFSLFPIIGLGDVMTTVTGSNGYQRIYCSTFSYRSDPIKKVYGLLFGIVGFMVIIVIVVGNSLVIRSILRINRRVTVGTSSISSLETRSMTKSDLNMPNSVPSFEIAFAKLMGSLAAVYLICEVPYNVSF